MITFNNIPTSLRTPGVYVEVDNSRALKGLLQNPHKVLIMGQKCTGTTVVTPTASTLVPKLITGDFTAAGYFGAGGDLDRMCRMFRKQNPNTEVWAIALSQAAGAISASCNFSVNGSATANGTMYLLVGGMPVYSPITSGWSATDICSGIASDVKANSYLAVKTSFTTTKSAVQFIAAIVGEAGNYIDMRLNFYEGQAFPPGVSAAFTTMLGGATNPLVADCWAVVDGQQFQHIVNPYMDATNLTANENEMTNRFGPMVDMQGFTYQGTRGTLASCATLGLTRNSPHACIIGANDSPTDPVEWAAALAGVCSQALNDDPARPVHMLTLKNVIPPTMASGNRFTQPERNMLLYDGIATWITDSSGNVMTERVITTYGKNVLGIPDASYLDIETMFTLMEIRYQYKARMANRFIVPRFKLVDDGNVFNAGQKIASPSIVKQEAISLFTLLRDVGLIENLDDFVTNIVVERDVTDVNRVNVLLPPNLVNQFRILSGQIQFIL